MGATVSKCRISECGEEWVAGENYREKYHRTGDLPAVSRPNGDKEWWVEGLLHRENDQPAIILGDGTKKWYYKGALWRPIKNGVSSHTIELGDGTRIWAVGDELYHCDGVPAVIRPNGEKEWWRYGRKFKVEFPDGCIQLFWDDKLDREEFPDGTKNYFVITKDKYGNSYECYNDGKKLWGGEGWIRDSTKYDRWTVSPDGTTKWYKNNTLHRHDGPAIKRADGSEEWYTKGQLHRADGPAIKRADGSEEWHAVLSEYSKSALHRTDGPAIKRADGSEEWYTGGQLHRTDGPAIKRADGSEEWYRLYLNYARLTDDEIKKLGGVEYMKSVHHRTDGPALTRADGSEEWYLNGKKHRVDGPAVIRSDWTTEWYLDGVLHRENGPAVTHPDGSEEWWLKGVKQ